MKYQKTYPLSGAKPYLYFVRGYNRMQTRTSILMNAEIDLVEE